MPTISELVVKIVGDTTGLSKSLTDSQKKMASFAVGATAVAAAAIAIGKAVARAADEFADYGSAIYDASQKTGMSTDAIQEWQFIAEQSGTTIEAVTTSFGTMTKTMKTNEDQYKSLGIEIYNADGTMRSANDVFNDTVTALSNMTNVTERDQAAFKLLGRGAQSLIPILNAGTGEITAMREQAHKLGIVLDKETITNADKLGDSTDVLKAAFTAAKNNMVNDLAPALILITNFLAKQIEKTLAAKEATEQLHRAERGETQTALERVSALEGARKELAWLAYDVAAMEELSAKDAAQLMEDRTKDLKLLIDMLEKQVVAEARWAEADRRGGEERKRIAEQAQRDADAAAKAAEEAAKREAKRLADEQKAIAATTARLAAEVRLREAISDGRAELFEQMEEFDKKTIEKEEEITDLKKGNIKELVTATKGAANDARTAWQKALDQSADDFKEWGDFAADQGQALVSAFADATMALGEALANGEDAWGSMAKVALQALGQVLEAIGYQLVALAAIHALAMDWGGAAYAVAGSVAAFVAAGLIKGWSNQFAMGTDFAPGGRAIVGENGPEVVNVPRGSSVTPAHRTMSGGSSSGTTVNIYSPVALNPSEAATVMKQTMQQLAFVGAL